MKITASKSIDKMLDAFNDRIDELQMGVDSSFDYPDDLEDLENGEYESHAAEPIEAEVDLDKLWEIADRYNSSSPLSGDWDSETDHEMNAISKELGVSKDKAKQLMIDELGFDEDMFASTCIKSSEVDQLERQLKDREVSKDELIDWLSEHDQAYDDIRDFFGVDDLDDLGYEAYDSIMDWIADHDRLYEDLINHFGHAALGIEDEVEECDMIMSAVDQPTKEVLDFLAKKGYDTDDREVKNYADAVAEYIDMAREAEGSYTLDQWYKDTKVNYPDELEGLPMIQSSTIMSSDMLNSIKVTQDICGISDDIVLVSDKTSGNTCKLVFKSGYLDGDIITDDDAAKIKSYLDKSGLKYKMAGNSKKGYTVKVEVED